MDSLPAAPAERIWTGGGLAPRARAARRPMVWFVMRPLLLLSAADSQAVERFDMGAANPERIDIEFVQTIAQGQRGVPDAGDRGGDGVEVGGGNAALPVKHLRAL